MVNLWILNFHLPHFFFLNGSLHISNDSTSYKNNLPLLDILSNGSARWEAILPQNSLQLKHLGKVTHRGFANILSAYQKSDTLLSERVPVMGMSEIHHLILLEIFLILFMTNNNCFAHFGIIEAYCSFCF